MFQLISPDKLVIGTKYKVIVNYTLYIDLTIDYNLTEYFAIFIQHVMTDGGPCLYFEQDHPTMKDKIYTYLFRNSKVYEFISEQPQWKMERRAVNMIVRRLLGDECFEW